MVNYCVIRVGVVPTFSDRIVEGKMQCVKVYAPGELCVVPILVFRSMLIMYESSRVVQTVTLYTSQ